MLNIAMRFKELGMGDPVYIQVDVFMGRPQQTRQNAGRLLVGVDQWPDFWSTMANAGVSIYREDNGKRRYLSKHLKDASDVPNSPR